MAKKLTKAESDHYLYEVAKQYKKMNKVDPHAELVIVGGGAIMLGYNFRDSTDDFDSIIKESSSLIKEIANKIGDENDLMTGWLNSDFSNTTSFSKELVLHSKFYKRFCNCLDVRVVPDEYLIAMKLMSGRKYKHDYFDIVGILSENLQKGTPISYERIKTAVSELYGSWDKIPEEMSVFFDKTIDTEDLEELYYSIIETEKRNRENLKEILEANPKLNNKVEDTFKYLDDFKESFLDTM